MEQMVVLIYDLAAVLIIVLTLAYSSQRGFATGFVRLIGQIAAFFGAIFLAKGLSGFVYTSFFKTEVMTFLNTTLSGGQLQEILAQLEEGIASLPRVAGNILAMGIDKDMIAQALQQGASELSTTLERAVIGPAVRGFLSVILFTLLFAIFGLIVKFLTSAVKFVFHSPILLPIDRFFGAVVGLVQAALNLYLICIVLKLVFYFVGGMQYCNQDIIMDTVIWSKLYSFDPLTLLAR